ncbi:hypothetical protein IFM47457_09810 [Aspergillus lentulus]|nr:hypothetical protein IFM47457_09810 [Aspergillus lentulus]
MSSTSGNLGKHSPALISSSAISSSPAVPSLCVSLPYFIEWTARKAYSVLVRSGNVVDDRVISASNLSSHSTDDRKKAWFGVCLA